MKAATPISQVSRRTPASIEETVRSVFGKKEFLPLHTFLMKMGMDRTTVLKLVAEGLLDVYEYSPGMYRKILVSRVSFTRFLKATSLRVLK